MFHILFLLCLLNFSDAAKILCSFMTPSFSHQIVYQPIWKELSLRGHQVTVLTPNPLNDPSLTNLTEIDLSFSRETFRRGFASLGTKGESLSDKSQAVYETYQRVSEVQLSSPEVQALIKDDKGHFDLFIVEMFYPSMYPFAQKYKCPMVGISSLGLINTGYDAAGSPSHPVLDPDFRLPFADDLTFLERLGTAFFAVFSRLYVWYEFYPKLDKVVRKYFDEDMKYLGDMSKDVSLILVNRHFAFQNPRANVPAVVEVSGLHVKEPKELSQDLKEFFDDAKVGAVYFSLGSNLENVHFSDHILKNIVDTLREIPYKVLWKTEANFTNLPENVKTIQWAPQQDVLAHPSMKLFITQGGLQSLEEAIYRGVPLLVLPLYGDQMSNAQRVVSHKIGLTLDILKLEKDNFKNAIKEITTNPTYKENIVKLGDIMRDEPWPALEKAIWWIEYVIRHKGAPQLKSKAVTMPLYQYYLLDVLGFLFVCFVAIIYVFRKIFKLIGRILKRITKTSIKKHKE